MANRVTQVFREVVMRAGSLSFRTNQSGAAADYRRYVYGQPYKTDQKSQPSLFNFTLVPWDSSFVKLTRGAYVIFDTATYPSWFTGYITSDPELQFIGKDKTNGQIYGYVYQATDDSYILNLKYLGLWQPFINTTCGAIIRALVAALDPQGMFDVSGIQDGLAIPRYIVDPNKKFNNIVQELADLSAFRFRANNYKLYFEPVDNTAAGLVVDGNGRHFTPSRLTVQPVLDPIVNDAVVMGGIEPQAFINEYFVGSGTQAQFNLLSGVYGVDSALLLDEAFSGSSFDDTVWAVFDETSQFLQISNGYLNVLGGSNNSSFDVYLQALLLLPLEGQLRMTHGQFDFVNSASSGDNGVICSLWTGVPNSSYTGCLYGIDVSKASGTTKLQPITNGTLDTSQSVTVDFSKQYIIRTLVSFPRSHRQHRAFGYKDQSGTTGSFGGDGLADTVTFNTFIAEVDPTNGNITNTFQWLNTFSVASNITVANYLPTVSNDLHCTVTGITISTPMQAALEIEVNGGSAYVKKIIGPNEIDSLDGLAPIATIQTTGGATGAVQAATIGTPRYNPGDAILGFFKDTARQISFIPQVGDKVHLSYRRAGIALGRIQSVASIILEATAFGDSGLRTLVKNDFNPAPRNSKECEYAAAAVIKGNSFQHYQGTYTQFSGTEITSEPLSGTVLKFQNLPTGFPSALQAEDITSVKTTMLAAAPRELFTHEIQFGTIDKVKKAATRFRDRTSLLGGVDIAQQPTGIDVSAVGLVFADDVTAPTLDSFDSTNFHLNTNQSAPSGGGFEVRFTDDSWGADDGKNLAARTSSATFTIPRNQRGKVCFIKAYDVRNKVLWSEDLTQAAWVGSGSGFGVSLVTIQDPAGNLALVPQVTWGSAGTPKVKQTSAVSAVSAQAVFSVDLRGSAGDTVTLALRDSGATTSFTQVITLTGGWQRVSVSGTFSAGASGTIVASIEAPSTPADKLYITHASLETERLTETGYFKTKSTIYGAVSRYPAAVRVNYPLIPPQPSATIDTTDFTNPQITVILPGVLEDVWGVEIRANDNTTVLYHQDLISSGYVPVVPIGNSSRSLSYYVYTYNLFGEFSTGFHLTDTLVTPTISSVSVDDTTKTLSWSGSNLGSVSNYQIDVDFTSSAFTHIVDTFKVSAPALSAALSDADFFATAWIRVTPIDDLGTGTSAFVSHSYTPAAPTAPITAPVNPPVSTTDPGLPTGFSDYKGGYTGYQKEVMTY